MLGMLMISLRLPLVSCLLPHIEQHCLSACAAAAAVDLLKVVRMTLAARTGCSSYAVLGAEGRAAAWSLSSRVIKGDDHNAGFCLIRSLTPNRLI